MLKSVVNFDLILSRKFENSKRLQVLQEIKEKLQKSYKLKNNEIDINRGDSLQLLVNSERALQIVLFVSAICKQYEMNIKAVIGTGVENEIISGEKVGLGYGPVFIHAGETFDKLTSNNFFKIVRKNERIEDKVIASYVQLIINDWNSKLALHVCDFFKIIEREHFLKISKYGIQTKLEEMYLKNNGEKISQSTISKRFKKAKISEILELLEWWIESLSEQ